MGRAIDTHGGEERYTQGFGGVSSRGKNYLEDLGVGRRIMLKFVFKKRDEGTVWMDLAQDRARWQPLVNVVMNLHVP
jgi:hypothetical protein